MQRRWVGWLAGPTADDDDSAGEGHIVVTLAPLALPGLVQLVSSVRGYEPHPVPMFALTCVLLAVAFLRSIRLARGAQRTRRRLRTSQDALVHQAFHDGLTGLANRALFDDRLEHAARKNARSGLDAAILFLDLDAFKRVNDTLGHAQGDELIRAVAGRLANAVRPGDTVARVGGDEFAVLIESSAAPLLEAEGVADRLLDALAQPVTVGDHAFTITASIGIAASSPDSSPTSVLRDADVAMYRAKAMGKARWVVYDPELGRATKLSPQ